MPERRTTYLESRHTLERQTDSDQDEAGTSESICSWERDYS